MWRSKAEAEPDSCCVVSEVFALRNNNAHSPDFVQLIRRIIIIICPDTAWKLNSEVYKSRSSQVFLAHGPRPQKMVPSSAFCSVHLRFVLWGYRRPASKHLYTRSLLFEAMVSDADASHSCQVELDNLRSYRALGGCLARQLALNCLRARRRQVSKLVSSATTQVSRMNSLVISGRESKAWLNTVPG